MADADGKSGRRAGINHPRRRLAALAARQGGVVCRDQLLELGVTDNQILRMVADAALHRVHCNVFAVGHPRLTTQASLVAAVLSAGPRSFLSHRTAAGVHGLRLVNLREIELTIPGTGGRRRDGLVVHRTRNEPDPADVRTRGDLRVSSVARMLIELAPRETPVELQRLVTEAVRKRLLRPDTRDGRLSLEAALARHRRHPGMARLAAVLATYRRPDSSKSQLEVTFDALLRQHPEFPDPQRNIHIDVYEIDRYWPGYRLAVELDGRPYHVAAQDMERDRIKDAYLLRHQITPLRFTDFRVEHDIPGILTDLHHFLHPPDPSDPPEPPDPSDPRRSAP
jgi:very-short-patch-repair endonuclease